MINNKILGESKDSPILMRTFNILISFSFYQSYGLSWWYGYTCHAYR